MMDCGTKSSIAKLRALRDELSKKQNKWQEAFDIKDSIVLELNSILEMAEDLQATKECVIERVDLLLELIDPARENEKGGEDV
jgi:hypothetical protein|tara:strand:+ start:66 stop:314 length:249 start_codon:yes stop_codon:yes gene_type:complete